MVDKAAFSDRRISILFRLNNYSQVGGDILWEMLKYGAMPV